MVYDYVIVGGGSAGCVLADRLSESGRHRVCLIEAGPADTNPLIHMPFGVVALVRGWLCNWKFWTEPQPHAGNRRMYQPRGKTLGGCSAINAMVCTRGHAEDFDTWARLGCEGWSYREVLPYFRKSEDYTAPLAEHDRPYHGKGGPLTVSARDPRHDNALGRAMVDAAIQAGYPANDDFNGASQEGVGTFKVFQRDGQRCSNARAYLSRARGRPNLSILTEARALEVLHDNGRARGVRILRKGREETIEASREVILSAGALQSPQLLMLSGIGPREELERHGIPVRHEMPGVGENLQDHLDVIVESHTRKRAGYSLHPLAWPKLFIELLRYMFTRRGMFSSNLVETGGFFRSSPEAPIPDLQWHFGPVRNVHHGFRLLPLLKGWGYLAFVCVLRPYSRGRVGLLSRDPLAPPRIDPNYFADPRDVELTVAGIRRTREVLAQAALDPYRGEEVSPGPALQDDAALGDWVRRHAETLYHPVGTCRMGADEAAVVDPQLRVRGISGLRVVDASIMPTITGSNTNAPTTMIAEKAADMILAAAA